jgi:hypothetical protein
MMGFFFFYKTIMLFMAEIDLWWIAVISWLRYSVIKLLLNIKKWLSSSSCQYEIISLVLWSERQWGNFGGYLQPLLGRLWRANWCGCTCIKRTYSFLWWGWLLVLHLDHKFIKPYSFSLPGICGCILMK